MVLAGVAVAFLLRTLVSSMGVLGALSSSSLPPEPLPEQRPPRDLGEAEVIE